MPCACDNGGESALALVNGEFVTMRMPYGKYQGRLLADLPGAYLAWFARKGFPDGELGRLLALALEIDHNGLSRLLDPLRRLQR